jgi:hypothetical protein
VITWNTEIVERLKTGSIGAVVLYNDSAKPRPEPPYAVVKPLPKEGAKLYRIYAHFLMGQQDELEAYIIKELPALLRAQLLCGDYRTDVIDTKTYNIGLAISDDGTISGSRDFYIPIIL